VDPTTGMVSWSPSVASPAETNVVLRAYDSQGAHATQEFTIQVSGVDGAPVFDPIEPEFDGQEGQALTVPVSATDPEEGPLVYWADRLPPGAVFDPDQHILQWTPGPHAAGSYLVRFVVSDGLHRVSETTTLVIAPTNQPPVLARPPDLTVREGEA